MTAREETMFLDGAGRMICTGSVVRAAVTVNQRLHGEWADYTVDKAPGGYKLSYLRSEKGEILPPGYTGGMMSDCLPDGEDVDIKTLVFTREPIQIAGWRIIE